MSRLRRMISIAAALALMVASHRGAFADSHGEAGAGQGEVRAGGAQRMTVPAGRIFMQGYIDINLSSDAAFKPVSIAPDVWYGLTDDISLGLVHTSDAAAGFFGGVGQGLCFQGSDNGCGSLYSNAGLAGRYHLFDGTDKPIVLAATGGVFFRDFDPFQLAVEVGAIGKWSTGAVDVLFGANLFFGLTEREGPPANKEVLDLPVTGMYAISPKLSVGGRTGLVIPFNNTGETFLIPLSVGARYMISPVLAVDGIFSFPGLAGGDAAPGVDGRVISIGASYIL